MQKILLKKMQLTKNFTQMVHEQGYKSIELSQIHHKIYFLNG